MKIFLTIFTIIYLISFGARLQRIGLPPKLETNNWTLSDTLAYLILLICIVAMYLDI